MKPADAGYTVNVASVFGLVAAPIQTAYCGSKFAVRGATDALRQEVEFLGQNIQVACASPAGIKTPIAQRAKVVLHPKSASTPELERKKWRLGCIPCQKKTAADILRGIKKGRVRIHLV